MTMTMTSRSPVLLTDRCMTFDELIDELAERRANGGRVVTVFDQFEVLQPSALAALREACGSGDVLIALVPGRLFEASRVTGEAAAASSGPPEAVEPRAAMLLGVRDIDYVALTADDPAPWIERLRPDRHIDLQGTGAVAIRARERRHDDAPEGQPRAPRDRLHRAGGDRERGTPHRDRRGARPLRARVRERGECC